MCGICGYIGRPFDRDLISMMTHVIKHRGPDAQQVGEIKSGALGQARLAIIDLNPNSNQPFESHDKKFTIVFNGEIYNYKTLREDCRKLGSFFRSESDTEVIIEAYRQWGFSAFEKLNGIFAFALYDNTEDTLLLVRDRWGVKPLYYSWQNNHLVFGSEIKSILKYSNQQEIISRQAFHEFIYYGNPIGEQTFFNGIQKLKAGHVLIYHDSRITMKPYWRIEDQMDHCADSFNEATIAVKNKLENAVKLQLVADVPVGIFLSGGIDSSAITAFATKHYASKMQTYSVAFDFDDGHNELPMAKIVAQQYKTEHHEIYIQGSNVIEAIEQLIVHHDEPFSDAANIPLYLLSKALNGSVKVVLQGDGGDEFFGGYKRYQWMPYATAISTLKPMINLTKWLWNTKQRARIDRFLHQLGEQDTGLRMAYMLTEENVNNNPLQVFSHDVVDQLKHTNPFASYIDINQKLQHLDTPQRLLWTDTQLLMQHQFLEKVDRSTLAFGLEVRVPFLENELSRYALSLPFHYKVRGLQSKYILKKALHGIVDQRILRGAKKGFGVPYVNWLRGPLQQYYMDIVFDKHAKHLGIIDQKVLQKLWDEHTSGIKNNGFMLWKILQFCLWYRSYNVKM